VALEHVPVLLEEVVAGLAVRPGALFVDGTYGAGGHSRALAALGARVLAFDRDPAARVEPEFAGSIELVHRNFDELASVLDERGLEGVDGVLFDLGVSSMQLDRPERGFSFQTDGPLDMRMNSGTGQSAADLIASSEESELADIIYRYGEERASRRIARAIVAARDAGRAPERTLDLARLVSGAVHVRGRRERIHPATRTFQALRIAVNDELGALERGLEAAIERTVPGGRIAVITFHSLEDRIVKQTFRADSRLVVLTKKPIVAGDSERDDNARSRSAKLRLAERAA